MAYKIYSVEALPRQGKGDTREYIYFNGFLIGPIPAGQWWTLKKVYTTLVHRDFEDKQGSIKSAIDDDIALFINQQWGHRGVAVVAEEELTTSQAKMEDMCKAANRTYRETTLRDFERQLEAWRVGQPGRAKPTAYEEECYQVLGWPAPNSVEALRAQRMPGEAAAERMMDAFEKVVARAAAPQAAVAVADEPKKEESDGRTGTQGRSHKAS